MSKNCECKRLIGPSGLWELEDLIGARVKVASVPVSNFSAIDCEQRYKIAKVEFRISLDGKCITVVILEGLPDMIFTLKDIEFDCLELKKKKEDKNNEKS